MSTLRSRSRDEASSTAKAEEMDVFPTPPLPPTKITGVSPLLLLLSLLIVEISSMRGWRECNRVDELAPILEEECTTDVVDHGAKPKAGRLTVVTALLSVIAWKSRGEGGRTVGDGLNARLTSGAAERRTAAIIMVMVVEQKK
mmetsp:Transcript_20942/g.44198  ORF Transcript_20942/g.44198 Transcript_20942/m.44198 type:complete len:143 (+) Transcript_20942:721-1149(+)